MEREGDKKRRIWNKSIHRIFFFTDLFVCSFVEGSQLVVRNENSGERKKQASQGERAGAKGSGKESIPYPDPLTFSSVAHARRTAAPTEGLKQAIFRNCKAH